MTGFHRHNNIFVVEFFFIVIIHFFLCQVCVVFLLIQKQKFTLVFNVFY